MKKVLFGLFILICTFFVLSFFYIKIAIYEKGNLVEPVNVIVDKGDGVKRIAWKLYKSGVIKSPLMFEWLTKAYKTEGGLRAGEYRFEPKISMYDAMRQIEEGKVFLRRITLPEGLTVKQMLDIIAQNDDLKGEISLEPKEGEMLPETYTFAYGDTKDSIIKQASAAMKKFVGEQWKNRDDNLPLNDEKDLIILASIVEKETGLAEERSLIASVFINRLKKGMMLQTDPTVIYAITKGKTDLGRPLLRKDLKLDDDYNTYMRYGLPPTPICSPSKEAILAVLHPQKSDFLYFVASGNGGHNFSKSLDEHNKNVSNYVKSQKKR